MLFQSLILILFLLDKPFLFDIASPYFPPSLLPYHYYIPICCYIFLWFCHNLFLLLDPILPTLSCPDEEIYHFHKGLTWVGEKFLEVKGIKIR